jgi:hypothetical protein
MDPYKLLGVTHESSLQDVRKAYFSLAIIMHPDKGGSKEDMHVLVNAYKWIKEQIEIVQSKGDQEYEVVQAEFDEFIKNQELDKPPPLTTILAEKIGFDYETFTNIYNEIIQQYVRVGILEGITDIVTNIEFMYSWTYFKVFSKFIKNDNFDDVIPQEELWQTVRCEINEYCKQNLNGIDYNTVITASIPHGYGINMVPSKMSMNTIYREILEQVYETIKINPVLPCLTDLVVYNEPNSQNIEMGTDLIIPNELDNYGLDKPISMTDYMTAFSDKTQEKEYLEKLASKYEENNESFEELIKIKELERILII